MVRVAWVIGVAVMIGVAVISDVCKFRYSCKLLELQFKYHSGNACKLQVSA